MARNFDNPNQPPQLSADTRDIQAKPIVEEITSDDDLKEFYRQREVNNGVAPERTAQLDKAAKMMLVNYKGSEGKIKVFAIKEQGKIIAGGQMETEGQQDAKRAYLGFKFVNPEKRGQKLAGELVKKRLEVAKELGCRQAYSLVRKDNFPALRSIVKDGFDVSSTAQQEGLGHLNESYFTFRDLTAQTPPSKIELAKVQQAIGKTEITGSELVIPLSDKKAVEQAFQAGFVGKFVFDANELVGVNEQVMYLEKIVAEK